MLQLRPSRAEQITQQVLISCCDYGKKRTELPALVVLSSRGETAMKRKKKASDGDEVYGESRRVGRV